MAISRRRQTVGPPHSGAYNPNYKWQPQSTPIVSNKRNYKWQPQSTADVINEVMNGGSNTASPGPTAEVGPEYVETQDTGFDPLVGSDITGGQDAFAGGGFDDFFKFADQFADEPPPPAPAPTTPTTDVPPPPTPATDVPVADAPIAETGSTLDGFKDFKEFFQFADEENLINEVMGSIRDNPNLFRGRGLLDYRTAGGQGLLDLPTRVQDTINQYLGGPDYAAALAEWEANDPATQLRVAREQRELELQAAEEARIAEAARVAEEMRVRAEEEAQRLAAEKERQDAAAAATEEEQRLRAEREREEAADRAAREAASVELLADQQAAVDTQTGSTEAIDKLDPTDATITNAASFVEDIPLEAEVITAPVANQDTGLSFEILNRLESLAEQRLQSDNELRRNQQALLADIVNQADAAGVSAVENLTLPDLTAVSVPPRTLSAMEQAIDQRLTDRLTGGRFLDPQSALTNEAEAQALERLQRESFLGPSTGLDTAEQAAAKRLATDSFLGQSVGLDAAEAAALKRLNEGGARVDLEGDLAVSAEDVIRQRLMGVDNPLLEAQRERVRERYGTSMEEGRELLNRLGVLRGGDSADVFNELTRGRDQQLLDVDALGYDLQSRAIADALGYQGRRDALSLANQDLARAAISDVAGLAGQRDQRAGFEQDLRRAAISDVAGLAGQRDQRAMAEEGLRRQAISDTMPFQQRRDAISLAEQDLQRAAIGDALGRQGMIDQRDLAESQLTGSLRGAATLPARIAQAGLQFDAAGLQQDVADRTLSRLLTQTEPTQREMFEESIRQAREGERLATRADTRAEDLLASEMFGEIPGRGSAPARQTLTGQGFEQDILNQELQRQLARTADTRAGQALEAELFGEVSGLGSDPTVRRTLAGQQFETAEDRAERALREGELTGQLQRRLAEADVTGIFDRQETRQAEAERLDRAMRERQLREGELTGQLQRRLAEADVTGIFDRAPTRQAAMDEFNREMGRSADERAGRQVNEALLSSQLQRQLAEADVTGIFDRAPTRQAQMDAFNRALAEAGLTGQYEGEDTFQRALAEAGLTGEYKGTDTLAGRQSNEALLASRLQRALAEADVTGIYNRQETRQAQMDNFNRLLAEAGLTGDFRGEDTLAQQQLDDSLLTAAINRRLAQAADTRAGQAQEAALFGEVSGVGSDPTVRRTMGGEGFDRDLTNQLISQILSSADPTLRGRLDPLAEFLSGQLGDEGLRSAIEEALDFTTVEVGDVGEGEGSGDSVVVVDGENVGGTGTGTDAENAQTQAFQRFASANNLGAGKYIFRNRNGVPSVFNAGNGQLIAVYNATTGEYEGN